MKYPSVFHLVSSVSEDKGAKLVLIGGFAVNHYKVTRQTADVDFLITKSDFQKIVPALEKEGYKKNYDQEVFTRLRTDTDYLIDLDFMFVDKETLDEIIKDGAAVNIAKQRFIVPSLSHLIALKLHSIKNNPKRRSAKDFLDIIELAGANKIDAGSKSFKELCLKYGTQDLYKEILAKV